MGEEPKAPNLVLRRIREQELRLTRVEFAEALAAKAWALGYKLEPGERYISRLEAGEIGWPHPPYRRALVALCRRPITELGFTGRTGARHGQADAASIMPAAMPSGHAPGAELLASRVPGADLRPGGAWPIWFGIRLAHLIALAGSWRFQDAPIGSLQVMLAQEVMMFNASAPAPGEPDHAAFDQSRRQALTTMAALPLAFATANVLSADGNGVAAAQDSFLTQCTASITACWQLLRGSDLKVVDHMLATYLMPLEGIAHQHSKYQKTAATLASQAHRMLGIVALHHKQVVVHEHHARQALRYATMASDVSGQASALDSLGQAYFYSSDHAQALATHERALALEGQMPPLQRSRLHAELSKVYGQLGREQDALRSAGRAEEIFPDHPEDDPSHLYAEFTPAHLGLKQGIAYLALAEYHEGRGYPERAADVLGRIDRVPVTAVSDRAQTEIANHQARASVLLNDLDAFELYINRGLDGAALLASKQRLREARRACKLAANRWPGEPRVKAMTARLAFTSAV